MLSRKFLGLDLIQKLVHLVGIDPWLEALDKNADLESRRFGGLSNDSEPNPQGLIDRGLEALSAASDGSLEPLGDVRIQSEGRTHENILMLALDDVKMLPSFPSPAHPPLALS
jgi:hypothetical protein